MRECFEAIISQSPFELSTKRYPKELSTKRYPDDEFNQAWPGAYVDIEVDLAWELFQAGYKAGVKDSAELCERFANRMMTADECADAVRLLGNQPT
jgi:hypothetical protein